MTKDSLYQYGDILCDCGYDYNEDKNQWGRFDELELDNIIVIKCPCCERENKVTKDWIYISVLGEEQETIIMVNEKI